MKTTSNVGPIRARLCGSGTVEGTGPVVCPSNSVKFSSNVENATVPGSESDVKEKPDKVPNAGTSNGTSVEIHSRRVTPGPAVPVAVTHRVLAINPVVGDARSLVHNVDLERAIHRAVRLKDALGKPMSGMRVLGATDSAYPVEVPSEGITVHGLGSSKRQRLIVFLDEKKSLGAVLTLGGESDKPVDVKPAPLGSVTGTILDADGNPLAGHTVVARLVVDRRQIENVRDSFSPFGHQISGLGEFTGRETKTDAEGRFRLDGLLHGQKYNVYAGEGRLGRLSRPTHHKVYGPVESGKVGNMGELSPPKKTAE